MITVIINCLSCGTTMNQPLLINLHKYTRKKKNLKILPSLNPGVKGRFPQGKMGDFIGKNYCCWEKTA